MLANDPFLLDIFRDGNDLRLRIDLDPTHTDEYGEAPVREIVYRKVRNLNALSEELQGKQGLHIYIEELEEGISRLWIDYHIDVIDVECEAMEEHRGAYTKQDLLAKSRRAMTSLDRVSTAYDEEASAHRRLRVALKKFADAEIDRATRRLEFFENQTSPRVHREHGIIDAYRRILKLLDSD